MSTRVVPLDQNTSHRDVLDTPEGGTKSRVTDFHEVAITRTSRAWPSCAGLLTADNEEYSDPTFSAWVGTTKAVAPAERLVQICTKAAGAAYASRWRCYRDLLAVASESIPTAWRSWSVTDQGGAPVTQVFNVEHLPRSPAWPAGTRVPPQTSKTEGPQ